MTHAHFLFLILFFRQFASDSYIFLSISYIYFSDTFILLHSLQSYAHLMILYCAFSSFSCSEYARYSCFFFPSLIVMFLALTQFNFFHGFFPLLRALSNLFLQPVRHCDFCNYALAPFHNIVILILHPF